jgi:hypothetical protein
MLKELTVTYHAPKGDSKVVEMAGHTFMDGKPEKIVIDEARLAKWQGNKLFECGEATDHKPEPPKHEPPKAKNDEHDHKDHKGR